MVVISTKAAYNRAAIMQNAVSAFTKTRICPLNANIFTDADFASSQTEISFVPTTNNISLDSTRRRKTGFFTESPYAEKLRHQLLK